MVAVVVVVLDEAPDLRFEITGQVIVLQQYPVLERLMPTLDLALGLGWRYYLANGCDRFCWWNRGSH